jgi:hypothetical protein
MNAARRWALVLIFAAAAAAADAAGSAAAEQKDFGNTGGAVASAGGTAASASGAVAVDEGRRAFGEVSTSWYDGETDSLAPLEFNDWEGRKLWNLGPLLKVLMWVTIAVLVVALVVLLYAFLRNYANPSARRPAAARGRGVAADQVEALAFLAERNRDDLLGQARFHYQQGNYGEAIIYLFSYQLIELDKFAVIRLSKGKTNRQYLREASRVAALGGALERTMHSFESVFFGRRPLDRAGFEACWNALPQFEAQLKAATP